MTLGGYATGLLVESHEGRPTKIEGNPDHPMSLGAASVFHQASILELYDPDRTRTVLRGGETSSWEEFLADLVPALAEQTGQGRRGPAHPDGNRHLADAGGAARRAAQAVPAGEMAPVRAVEPGQRARTARDASAHVDAHYDFEKAKVVVVARQRFPLHPSGQPALRAAVRPRPARRDRSATPPADDEPPLRRGADADHHRHDGRPPAGRAARDESSRWRTTSLWTLAASRRRRRRRTTAGLVARRRARFAGEPGRGPRDRR